MTKTILTAIAAIVLALSIAAPASAGPLDCKRLKVESTSELITLVFPTKGSGPTTVNLKMDAGYALRGGDVRSAGECETPDVGKVVAYQILIRDGKAMIPVINAKEDVEMNVCITPANGKRSCATATWSPGDKTVEFVEQSRQKF